MHKSEFVFLSKGIISNLITFPPTFLIVQMFRRSRARHTRTHRLRQVIKESFEKSHEMGEESGVDLVKENMKSLSKRSAHYRASDMAGIVENEEVPEVDEGIGADGEEGEQYAPAQDLSADYEKPKQPLGFPWWCRFFALGLSWACMVVSAFFIVVKGNSKDLLVTRDDTQ